VKGAVVNLSRELGLEYAASGIQVNALCPGFVRTGLSGGVYEDPEFAARVHARVPMGRVAEPDMESRVRDIYVVGYGGNNCQAGALKAIWLPHVSERPSTHETAG